MSAFKKSIPVFAVSITLGTLFLGAMKFREWMVKQLLDMWHAEAKSKARQLELESIRTQLQTLKYKDVVQLWRYTRALIGGSTDKVLVKHLSKMNTAGVFNRFKMKPLEGIVFPS